MDSILIANELIDEYKSKGTKGWVVNLDFEKASDLVDWDFLIQVMKQKLFRDH